MTRHVDGLEALVHDYDAFVLDQWGVLHDGVHTYPGVLETLTRMAELNKEVVILTNSSKTSRRNIDRLRDRFALPEALYRGLVSTAQLLHDTILERTSSSCGPHPTLTAPYVIADEGDEVLLDDLPITPVHDIVDATSVVLLSVPPGAPTTKYTNIIAATGTRQLAVLTPSADTHSVRPGILVHGMAGLVAALHDAGATIENFGKPSTAAYDACRTLMHPHEPSRVLAVGDQIASDVRGAAAAGWHTLLVLTGAGRQSLDQHDQADAPDFIAESLHL